MPWRPYCRYAYFFDAKNTFEVAQIVVSLITIVFWAKYSLSDVVESFDVNAEQFVDMFQVL